MRHFLKATLRWFSAHFGLISRPRLAIQIEPRTMFWSTAANCWPRDGRLGAKRRQAPQWAGGWCGNQLQLLQPFFGLALAATLLGEPVSGTMIGVTVAIVACVAGARRWAG